MGEYIDNGISARKSPSKRPALQELLRAIPSKQIAIVAFTKLDRWTRNVKGYYQVQDALDRHKVAWIAIQEDYETITASGRFKVNIMLSVAENEADRTSERIKSVFEHKVNLGQPITNALPIGFSISGKTLVHDDNAAAAIAAFECYAKHGNKTAVRNMLQDKYGFRMSVTAVTNLLHNTLYIGEYRGNTQYCEPIISRALFDCVQRDLQARATRKTPSGRVYLFAGLIVCKKCGRRMSSIHSGEGRDYYRCSCGHGMYHDCPNKTYVRESKLEASLVRYLSDISAGKMIDYKAEPKPSQTVNRASIQRKLERLKELYIDGDITKEKYRQQRDELSALLAVKEDKPIITKLIGDNFQTYYESLDRAKKKEYWRLLLEKVEIGSDGSADVFFIGSNIQIASHQMATCNLYRQLICNLTEN